MADNPFQRVRRLLSELKRRNVYQVAATYAVVGFVLIQVADLTFVRLGLPAWTITLVIVLVATGFPLALVLAWAFERTPEGMRRTSEADPSEGASAEGGVQISYKVLVGIGLLAAAVAGGWYLTGGGGEAPEISERTVAVLPFEVSGSGTETWRDGMVTYLTPGLDGAAGLRAIPDRTVFAAWEERAQPGEGASADEALGVARQVGAQYAVVGSAGGLGSEVRFAVEVYETPSGERLGQAEVRGSPDSVPSLADRLTRRVLGIMLEKTGEDLPSVDLGNITTRSPPALKAYLRGERHFRAGEYEAAVEDYTSAVAADSTFALAYARLSTAHGWQDRLEVAVRYAERAYELSDQLPARDRVRVRASHLRYEGRALAAVDTLQRALDRYPDDPALWYDFGEVLIHGYVPPGWRRAEKAFQRSVELDPDVEAYHHHLVHLGFALHRDSSLVARRISAHPDGYQRRIDRIAWDLVFGSPDRRDEAWARVDTASIQDPRMLAEWTLLHPEDARLSNRVLRRLRKRSGVNDRFMQWLSVFNAMRQGAIDRGMRLHQGPQVWKTCTLARWASVGIPLPSSSAGSIVSLADELERDTISQEDFGRLYCVGLLRLAQGATGSVDPILEHFRDAVPSEDLSEADIEPAIRELSAFQAWQEDDLRQAAAEWEGRVPLPNFPNFAVHRAIWRGDLAHQLGRLDEAAGWYLAAWRHPVAHERLGRLYEKMDKPEKAAVAYRRFIAAWEDADEELQPRVGAARERVRQLTGSDDASNE